MSQALSVEKTSKRGGRIVHEKDLMPPPMFGESFKAPKDNMEATPPNLGPETDEYGEQVFNPDSINDTENNADAEDENGKPSITEIMKNPSKVVLCKVSCYYDFHDFRLCVIVIGVDKLNICQLPFPEVLRENTILYVTISLLPVEYGSSWRSRSRPGTRNQGGMS